MGFRSLRQALLALTFPAFAATAADFLVGLGSGDGVTVIAAAKRGSARRAEPEAAPGTALAQAGDAHPVGRLSGDQLRFTAGGAEYRARVTGEALEGTIATDGGVRLWKAVR